VSGSGQPRYDTNMYFTHRFPMVKFRLSENLALDYSDFVDEGLRVAVSPVVGVVSRVWRLCLRNRLWSSAFQTLIYRAFERV
jgi:hypothetical protein